jgi:membrane protein implicated in regulation of membrane protease activity
MEEMDRFKTAWQTQPMDGALDNDAAQAVVSIRQRLEWLHRALRRRYRLEIGWAVAGMILFACLAGVLRGTLARVGAAVVVAGLVLVIVKLHRARSGEPALAFLSVKDFCTAEMASVDAQMALLNSVAWWYLGPVIVGVNLFFAGLVGMNLKSLAYLVLTLVVAARIYTINRRAVRQTLQPIRDRLATILEQLAGDERAGMKPRQT